MVSLSDPGSLAILFTGLFLGALLKGATGVGLPVIAIPTIAAVYDVRVAVVLLVIPNFFTNIRQIHKYQEHNLKINFARNFALAGIVGAGLGTVLLAYLPLALLNIIIAVVVIFYIALRLFRPEFHLSTNVMQQWELVAGSSAGVLQGAIGLSAPITITFLHACRLPRPTFIFIASLFFASMCLIQLPVQAAFGLMTFDIAILSMLALIPIFAGLPIGERIGRTLSATVFDQIILVLLTSLAAKMLVDAWLSFSL